MAQVTNKPSLVEHRACRFLIIDCPTDANLDAYIREMQAHKVVELVRACEARQSYSRERVEASGVHVNDLAFADGEPPPDAIIKAWLKLCKATFSGPGNKDNKERRAVAVHCIAGLGRAPVLVAIALIEEGMGPLDAIAAVRAKRRGAINSRQLEYLQYEYERQQKSLCTVA